MLIDHRLRLFDPVQGRWLSRDPIGYFGGEFNLYEYLRSNPTKYLDPAGTDSIVCDAKINYKKGKGEKGESEKGESEKGEIVIQLSEDSWTSWENIISEFAISIEDPHEPDRVWVEVGGKKYLVKKTELRIWVEQLKEDLGRETDENPNMEAQLRGSEFVNRMIVSSFRRWFDDDHIFRIQDVATGADIKDDPTINPGAALEGLEVARIATVAGIEETRNGFLFVVGTSILASSGELLANGRSNVSGPRRIGGKEVPSPAERPATIRLVTNTKHHFQSASPEPSNVQELFESSILSSLNNLDSGVILSVVLDSVDSGRNCRGTTLGGADVCGFISGRFGRTASDRLLREV